MLVRVEKQGGYGMSDPSALHRRSRCESQEESMLMMGQDWCDHHVYDDSV